MQIAINDKNEITGYADVGNIMGGVDFVGVIPADFAPNKYLWEQKEITVDENGEAVSDGECIITKTIPVETEDGVVYEDVTECGDIVPNPDYVPPMPEITEEQRISAMEDAVAELIEMMLGGE